MKYFEYIQITYHTLINTKGVEYNANNYKWLLGACVVDGLIADTKYLTNNPTTYNTLFGIKVDIDYANPYEIKLYEDITNKIGIKVKLEEV